jgi:thiopurine S-methyltransferase
MLSCALRCIPCVNLGALRCTPCANLAKRARSSSSQATTLRHWLQLWKSNGDVFTLPSVNENLVHFEAELIPPFTVAREQPAAVLVPLCGRSADLQWLAKRSYKVVGIDAIAEPLRQWAFENGGLEPVVETDVMSSYRSLWYPNLSLLHGNIFDLRPEALGSVLFDAVWDRGGITSLARADRVQYANLLSSVMQPSGKLLLEFLSCNLKDFDGTMTIAAATEVLRTAGFAVSVLKDVDVLDAYPQFNPPNLEYLQEVVLIATKCV